VLPATANANVQSTDFLKTFIIGVPSTTVACLLSWSQSDQVEPLAFLWSFDTRNTTENAELRVPISISDAGGSSLILDVLWMSDNLLGLSCSRFWLSQGMF
jgi:hypothetical protein